MATITDPTTTSRARSGSITTFTQEINPIKSQIVQLIADIHDAEQRFSNQIPSSYYANLRARMEPLMLQTNPELADSQKLLQQAFDLAAKLIKKEEPSHRASASASAPEQKKEEQSNHCYRDTAIIVGALAAVTAVVITPSCRIQ